MIANLISNRTKQFFFLPLLIFSLTLFFTISFSQGNVVTGKVISSTGEPLPGASVIVKGTKIGTSTDNNGSFSLGVSNPNST